MHIYTLKTNIYTCVLKEKSCYFVTETKRARSELKKRSTDTLRMQKKARKGGLPSAGSSSSLAQGITASLAPLDTQQRLLQCGLQQLGECEGRAVRAALTESRGRFCLFVALLRPVLVSGLASVFKSCKKIFKLKHW